MSEYDKVMSALNSRAAAGAAKTAGSACRKYLLSGDSEYQTQIITSSALRYPASSVILVCQNRSFPYREAFRRSDRCVFLGEGCDTAYRPFAGHSAKTIRKMLALSAENPSAGLKLLLGVIAELLAVDPLLLEKLADSFVSADLFDQLLGRYVQTRKITADAKDRYLQRLRSCSSCFGDFEALISDLPECIRSGSPGRFQTVNSLRSYIADRRILVFCFRGDMRQRSDASLLQILSLDLQARLEELNEPLNLIIDDFPYPYLRHFALLFDDPRISAILNLCTSADYVHHPAYAQFVKSKFNAYGIFSHNNTDFCNFWSNAIGMAEVAENTYGDTSARGMNIPRGVFYGSVIHREHSSSVNVHYVDKNVVKPYVIGNLKPSEYFYYEKGNRSVLRLSV